MAAEHGCLQYLDGPPLSEPAVRAARDLDTCHAFDEGGCIFTRLRVRRRHGQGLTCLGQPLGLGRCAEQPVVADALEAEWQDMLHEAGDERLAIDQRRALAAAIVSANSQAHALGVDADDTFVGDGHAVRVARQIVQHHLGSGQRRLRIHHPVVTLEL